MIVLFGFAILDIVEAFRYIFMTGTHNGKHFCLFFVPIVHSDGVLCRTEAERKSVGKIVNNEICNMMSESLRRPSNSHSNSITG